MSGPQVCGGGASAIRSLKTMATWGKSGRTKNPDNYLSDVGRNSQPAKWAADSRTPTVANGLQSVKRGTWERLCKSDAETRLVG